MKLLLGAELIDAEATLGIDLINKLFQQTMMETALAMAEAIAPNSPPRSRP